MPAKTFLDQLRVIREALAASTTESTPRKLDRLEKLGRAAEQLGREIVFA